MYFHVNVRLYRTSSDYHGTYQTPPFKEAQSLSGAEDTQEKTKHFT